MISTMNMKSILFYLLFLFLISLPINGAVYVLELNDEEFGYAHGDHVLWVACHGKPECVLQFFGEVSDIGVIPSNMNIVNMSFSHQLGDAPTFNPYYGDEHYDEELLKYEQQKRNFERAKTFYRNLMVSRPNTLFTISSGNGMVIGAFHSLGVALGSVAEIYPGTVNGDNIIKVAAINTNEIDMSKLESYQLTDYANFSLEYVDLATVAEANQNGKFVKGTSFAAPAIARVADELRTKDPNLSASDTKKIFMKSCYVPKIDKAIAASIDLNKHGRKSKVFWAQNEKNRTKRNKIQKEIGDIILVKCGGFLIPEIAKECHSYFQQGMTINNACLKAHQEVLNTDTTKLKKLWSIRNI